MVKKNAPKGRGGRGVGGYGPVRTGYIPDKTDRVHLFLSPSVAQGKGIIGKWGPKK